VAEAKGSGSNRPNPDGTELLESIFGRADDGDRDSEHRSGFVALVGRPNVGKSTLLNQLVGKRVAIVSPRPQTTRRRILGLRTTEHVQAIFVDTPGIHRPRNPLDRAMVREAQAAAPDADLIVWVIDVSTPPGGMDRSIAGTLRSADRPILLALNKSDRLGPDELQGRVDEYIALAGQPVAWTLTIATTGHNVDLLWDQIASRLPEGPNLFPEDQLTDQSPEQQVSERIREAALVHLRQEVPYGVEVVVDSMEERGDGLVEIDARLIVEQDRHKGMVIGKGGRMLERIGTSARKSIEGLLGARVFLDIEVIVRDDWRNRDAELRRLGYE